MKSSSGPKIVKFFSDIPEGWEVKIPDLRKLATDIDEPVNTLLSELRDTGTIYHDDKDDLYRYAGKLKAFGGKNIVPDGINYSDYKKQADEYQVPREWSF